MRPEKIRSWLITAGIAFCMSFGAVTSVATGLELSVDLMLLAIGCLLGALIVAAAYSVPKGGRMVLILGALALAFLIMGTGFMEQLLDICRTAVTLYSQAYGFPVPEVLRQAHATDHILPLLTVAVMIQLVTAWIMLHRYPAALAVFTAVLPLISCFVVTDTVPRVWCLSVWLFGIAMLLMTQSVRIRSPRSADRLTGLLSLPLILGLTLLMLAVPEKDFTAPISQSRFQSALDWVIARVPFLGQTSEGRLVFNFSGDLPDQVDLAELGDRDTGDSPVLEVTPDWSGKIYLRIRDQDIYTGEGWEVSDATETFSQPPEALSGGKRYLEIRVLGNRSQMLLPYYPDADVILEDGAAAVDRSDRSYSFDVAMLQEDWAELWRDGISGNVPEAEDIYLELPAQTLEDAERILADIPALRYGDTVAAAEAIGSYVSRTAEYSQEVDRMPSDWDDFAIWFLEEADRGYCVHFATAATVLLRAQGIPARYVEGYAFDAKAWEINEVRQDMAHAWVEYYVDGVGWVVLDPTPGTGGAVTVEPTAPSTEPSTPNVTKPTEPDEPDPTEPDGTKPTRPEEPDPTEPDETRPTEPEGTGPDRPEDPDGTVEGGGTGPQSRAPEDWTMPRWLVNVLTGLAAVAGLAAAILGQWIGRRWWKLRRLRRGGPGDRVIARYREAVRICRAVKAELPEELERLAEKAVYSQHTITREELAVANTAFASCFALLEKGRWYQKLIWRFVLALY